MVETRDGYRWAWITMPPVGKNGDAYFLGLSAPVEGESDGRGKPRYFALEKSFKKTTMLCEVDGGRHQNHGLAPDATLEGFVEAVVARCTQ